MLYSNSSSKNKTGDQDPFDRKKLAREAEADALRIKAVQKDQNRRKLQLQIDNYKREMDRLTMGLRAKQLKQADLKRDLEIKRRALFVLETQIKQKEGGLGYLNSGQVSPSQENEIKTKLSALEAKRISLGAEIAKIKKEISEREILLSNKTGEMNKVEQEIKNSNTQSEQISSVASKVNREVSLKKKDIEKSTQERLFKKGLEEEKERELELLNQEVSRLERELRDKEREKKNLEMERDRI